MSAKVFPQLALFVLAPLAVAQVQLQFPAFSGILEPANYSRVIQLPGGSTLLAGSYAAQGLAAGIDSGTTPVFSSPNPHTQILLTVTSPNSNQFQPLRPLDGGNDVPLAAAVDPTGNIWIAGNTDADDFNLVNPIVSQKAPYRTVGFVLEVDPTVSKILFATYLGGHQSQVSNLARYATYATAIAIDAAGNVYVGGSTDEPDFPVTTGAYLTQGPRADIFMNTVFYSYVVKISPAGKLAYGTFLGTGSSSCVGGSTCLTRESTNAEVEGLAADSTGAVTAVGVQGGAFSVESGYVSRLGPDGSKLLWSATLGANYGAIDKFTMAQDASGNVDLLGRYAPVLMHFSNMPPTLGTPGLFAARLSSDGSTVLYSTDLGQSADANPAGIALDASGNSYLAGTSSSAQFPTLAGVPDPGADFVLRLDSSGAKPLALFRFPLGVVSAPPAFDSSSRLLLLSCAGALLALPPSYAFNTPAIVAFANAASFALNTGLGAGELVSLFGFDLDGSPQNVQVLIGGVPAPLLYVGPTQINVQVPFGISSPGPVQLQVVLPSGSLSLDSVPLAPSLGIFTTDGVHAAALNQDGSYNTASNPAAAGSVVSLFGTGAIWPNTIPDGSVAASAVALSQELNQFEVVDSQGTPLTILYAGSAAGILNGVFRVNVQLPQGAVPPLTLTGRTGASNLVQIFLQ
ncbi:MAG TPA: SBBP repeat-containing protein [Bryobacteraceae bacterium]|nr:SBBP repeat-containing protein [Bryobacteraceae bacterium]